LISGEGPKGKERGMPGILQTYDGPEGVKQSPTKGEDWDKKKEISVIDFHKSAQHDKAEKS